MVTSAPTLGHGMDPRVPSRRMLGGILLGTLVAGAIAGELVATGRGIVVLAFVLLFVPVVIARNPDLAPAFVLAPALLIEQSPIDIGSGINRITDHLPLFGGLGPSHLDGSDLLLIGLFIIWAVKVAQPSTRLPRSAIGTSLIVLEAAVVLGFVVGFAHHGDSRIAFLEMRPYVYLAASFFLASRLGTTRALAARRALGDRARVRASRRCRGSWSSSRCATWTLGPTRSSRTRRRCSSGSTCFWCSPCGGSRCRGVCARRRWCSCRSCSRRIWRTAGEPRSSSSASASSCSRCSRTCGSRRDGWSCAACSPASSSSRRSTCRPTGTRAGRSPSRRSQSIRCSRPIHATSRPTCTARRRTRT